MELLVNILIEHMFSSHYTILNDNIEDHIHFLTLRYLVVLLEDIVQSYLNLGRYG